MKLKLERCYDGRWSWSLEGFGRWCGPDVPGVQIWDALDGVLSCVSDPLGFTVHKLSIDGTGIMLRKVDSGCEWVYGENSLTFSSFGKALQDALEYTEAQDTETMTCTVLSADYRRQL